MNNILSSKYKNEKYTDYVFNLNNNEYIMNKNTSVSVIINSFKDYITNPDWIYQERTNIKSILFNTNTSVDDVQFYISNALSNWLNSQEKIMNIQAEVIDVQQKEWTLYIAVMMTIDNEEKMVEITL